MDILKRREIRVDGWNKSSVSEEISMFFRQVLRMIRFDGMSLNVCTKMSKYWVGFPCAHITIMSICLVYCFRWRGFAKLLILNLKCCWLFGNNAFMHLPEKCFDLSKSCESLVESDLLSCLLKDDFYLRFVKTQVLTRIPHFLCNFFATFQTFIYCIFMLYT